MLSASRMAVKAKACGRRRKTARNPCCSGFSPYHDCSECLAAGVAPARSGNEHPGLRGNHPDLRCIRCRQEQTRSTALVMEATGTFSGTQVNPSKVASPGVNKTLRIGTGSTYEHRFNLIHVHASRRLNHLFNDRRQSTGASHGHRDSEWRLGRQQHGPHQRAADLDPHGEARSAQHLVRRHGAAWQRPVAAGILPEDKMLDFIPLRTGVKIGSDGSLSFRPDVPTRT